MSYQHLTAAFEIDPKVKDTLLTEKKERVSAQALPLGIMPLRIKSERSFKSVQALDCFSFMAKPQKSDDSSSHRIRTPLHGILNAVELLQKAYTSILATLGEEKVSLEAVALSLKDMSDELSTLTKCIAQLTEPASLSPKSMASRCQKQVRAFSAQALTSLTDMQTQLLSLQTTHQMLQDLLAKKDAFCKEDIKLLVAMNVDTLATIDKQAAELTQLANKLLGSPVPGLPVSALKLEMVCRLTVTALIVDDNIINQKVLASHLKKLGYHYEIASNGQEAVELCKKKKFDIIFMDINMPVMDGYKASQAIRQQEKDNGSHPPIPIICVTANADAAHEAQAIASGMNDFVAKPFTQAAIKAILRTHMNQPSPSPFSSSSEGSSPSAGVLSPLPKGLALM